LEPARQIEGARLDGSLPGLDAVIAYLAESVVRIEEPRFDLQSVLDHYNALWGKAS
jgi:hypothetical protein